ncbi:MAG: S4 domain-containing protein [Croceibacterium sp.]
MRLDKLLFDLRFAKTRGAAQRWIREGHMRRNGERVVRQDLAIVLGDVLTLPLSQVMVIELLAMPQRRGPANEARACYRVLDGALDGLGAKAIGAPQGLPEGTVEP